MSAQRKIKEINDCHAAGLLGTVTKSALHDGYFGIGG